MENNEYTLIIDIGLTADQRDALVRAAGAETFDELSDYIRNAALAAAAKSAVEQEVG